MKKFLSIAIVLFVSSVAFAEPPTPGFIVDGYTLTFQTTDVVQIMPAPVIVKGTVLNDPSLVAKSGVPGQLVVDLEPDVHYSIFMLSSEETTGDSIRLRVDVDGGLVIPTIVVPLTRTEKIRKAYGDFGEAQIMLHALNPNFDEYTDALGGE